MKATFLGTGTSVGIPAIGCNCRVCRSTDVRNRRRRTSLYVEADGTGILVDTPPDFREQALTYHVPRVDAVLFTHGHADHVFGFDDIRRYNTMQQSRIPAYGSPATLDDLRRIFDYVDAEQEQGVFRPHIDFVATSGSFEVAGCRIVPLEVIHGNKPTQGYRIDCGGSSLAYRPDCHRMSDAVVALCRGVDVMVLDGLRHRPHSTHLTVAESVALLQRIGAPRSFLTHMCHDLDHADTEAGLPEDIRLAYDGLSLDV
jgi:phosphoribosyl 1,2-cyclic phosphate phosphodiesterase